MVLREENQRKRIVFLFFEDGGWILLKIREKVMVVIEKRRNVKTERPEREVRWRLGLKEKDELW
jgi:hypothetical protein